MSFLTYESNLFVSSVIFKLEITIPDGIEKVPFAPFENLILVGGEHHHYVFVLVLRLLIDSVNIDPPDRFKLDQMVHLMEKEQVGPVGCNEVLQVKTEAGVQFQRRCGRRSEKNGEINVRVLIDNGYFFSRENRFAALLLRAEKVAQGYAVVLADIDQSFHGFTIDETVFSVNMPLV